MKIARQKDKINYTRSYGRSILFLASRIQTYLKFESWGLCLLGIKNMPFLKFKSILLDCSQLQQDLEIKNLATAFQIDSKNALDYFEVTPQKKQISIDQIREIKRHIYQKPVKAKVKFVVFKDADMLTIEAQNALLKLLEEPPSHAIIVLSTERKQKLLPTIMSRTVEINIRPKRKQLEPNTEFPIDNFKETLTILSQIENPKEWIDRQIENYYQMLLSAVDKNNKDEIAAISERIENLSYSKKLIEANVNPKFALFNLALPASI